MPPDLPPELWIRVVELDLDNRWNMWQTWLSDYRHVSRLFKDAVELPYIQKLVENMGVNFDPGVIDDESLGQDYPPIEDVPDDIVSEAKSTSDSDSEMSADGEIDISSLPLNGPPQGLLLRFDRLQCEYAQQCKGRCGRQGSCHRDGRIAVVSRKIPSSSKHLTVIRKLLKSTMAELPNGLGSHRRLFVQFERVFMSTDLLPADLHFFEERSEDGDVKICLSFDWRRYLTTFLREEREVALENHKFQTAVMAYRAIIHFKAENGEINGTEREDLIMDPQMSEILLEHRERGKRIARRRREENIAQRKHWGSFTTNESRRALRPHIQLTEDLSIRKWIHMHQYWDVERRIWSEMDGWGRDIMFAHDGEEWAAEESPVKGDSFHENSKWLYFHVLRAVDDEYEASQVTNFLREDEVLQPHKEKWDSWITAIRDEYSDFHTVVDWDDPAGYEMTREALDEDIEDDDRYDQELAWARGDIFGPYPEFL
ncbi:hypothetical protein NA57DRAFT_59626 [Rhizodiscina lignyota]|uniref:Uncharacterized protein n=1 Tax=Rhizodiscina lignyota TaxID=1504668 RepID=A0A9P4IAD9_9PEZI|nr:hypothetical protein NA57DRAFT_59626 [Rhizodiscina lignyota]